MSFENVLFQLCGHYNHYCKVTEVLITERPPELRKVFGSCMSERVNGWYWDDIVKSKFHLARQFTYRHENIHFGCVELVKQHGSTRLSRRARHVEHVESCRDVTWRAKWNLSFRQRIPCSSWWRQLKSHIWMGIVMRQHSSCKPDFQMLAIHMWKS